jgi:hypothetical protein
MIARLALALPLILLAACAPAPAVDAPERRVVITDRLPPMRLFTGHRALPPARPNAEIARDFIELSFWMESGRELPALTRFEGPITLAVAGSVPASVAVDLPVLLARLRTEAGIDIRQTARAPANVTVEFVSHARMQAVVPHAACFVVPRVSSWAEFRANRRSPRLDWTTLDRRERVAVFIPGDVSPQEVRDCMHEEIAQALGPLNDLYRLHDSVFNDDNFQTVLTGFDMLILRAYNDPALQSGMTRTQVAARLPEILRRLNPAGERPAGAPAGPTPRAWVEAVETALGPRGNRETRRAAAMRALAIARDMEWRDSRMAFSLFALGRLARAQEGELALASFLQAASIWRELPGAEIHLAHVEMQLAAFALSAGQPERALALVDRGLPAARQAENASLLASFQMIRAQSFEMLGRTEDARAARLDSLGWARYGFGPEEVVRTRLSEIAVLAPANTEAMAP